MSTRFLCLALGSLALLSFGHAEDPSEPGDVWAGFVQEFPAGTQVVRGGNELGFELFQQLFNEAPADNIFISPTSIAMALTMAWNGAQGETRAEMAEVLGLSGLDDEVTSLAPPTLLEALKSAAPAVALDIANSIWVRQGIPLAEDFVMTSRQQYQARVTELDFNSPAAPGVINEWVSKQTRDRIKEIVRSIDRADIMFLINAVYFKGQWTEKFDNKLTQPRDFHLADGSTYSHPMMSQSGEYRYYAGEGFQAIRLPYADGRVSMLVFVPDLPGGGGFEDEDSEGEVAADYAEPLADFVRRLDQASWSRWQDSMRTRKGQVVLPKFKLEYEETLNEALAGLGMEAAFDPGRADFNGMLPAEIDMAFFISKVKHKTFVEVSEEGTEAAAVTSVVMTLAAMPTEEPFVMVIDRPFLYAIQDGMTGALLFLGAVLDPRG